MRTLFSLFLLLTLPVLNGYGQVFSLTPGKPLVLSWPQQVRVAVYVDSLQQVAANARVENGQLGRAATSYRVSADSLRSAIVACKDLRVNQEAVTEVWRTRARKRGLLNYVFIALAGGVGYLAIFR